MSSVILHTQPKTLQNGAQHVIGGAAKGAAFGIVGILASLAYAAFHAFLETSSRARGNGEKWVINYNDDCQLEQFRDLSACTTEPISFMTFAGALLVTSIAIGTIGGARKSYQELQKAEKSL